MALCRFTNGANTIAVDAPAEREWAAVVTGRAGTATITLPRSSPAARSTYIDPEAGSTVRIAGQGGCGDWFGPVTGLAFEDGVIRVTAMQPWQVLGKRLVERPLALVNVTPGYVATVAVREALGGLPWFNATLPFDGGPLTLDYEFSGQDVWSVFSDLMARGGGELHIDPVDGRMAWCGPLAYATQHEGLLIAGTDLQGWGYEESTAERVSQVTATLDRLRYTANAGRPDGWGRQATITAGRRSELVQAATTELARLSAPTIVVRGAVTAAWWGVRERDYLRALLPGAGFTGRTHTVRVLSRALADGASLMTVELLVIDTAVALAQGIAARQEPPSRRSFAAAWQDVQRVVNRDRATTR